MVVGWCGRSVSVDSTRCKVVYAPACFERSGDRVGVAAGLCLSAPRPLFSDIAPLQRNALTRRRSSSQRIEMSDTLDGRVTGPSMAPLVADHNPSMPARPRT